MTCVSCRYLLCTFFKGLSLKLYTFSKGLFSELCTFFKGLFLKLRTFSKGLSFCKYKHFAEIRKMFCTYFTEIRIFIYDKGRQASMFLSALFCLLSLGAKI